MKPSLLLRLALAGTRTDLLRVALTSVSAALATAMMLGAAVVLAIDGPDVRYQVVLLNHFDLRQSVAAAMALLCVPVLALAAQAGRVGAPGRDRRLAALRLAGATPHQVTWIAVAETGLASALGSLAALAACLVARSALHRRDFADRLWLPTDVRPWPWLLVLIVAGLPVASALVAAKLLRGVRTSPLGVVRDRVAPTPRPWPALLLITGPVAYTVVYLLQRRSHSDDAWAVPVLLFGGATATAAGLALSMGWVSDRAGRLLHRFGRGPAALLAARHLRANPWTASRTMGVLLVCALVAGGAAAMRTYYELQYAALNAAQLRYDQVTGQVHVPTHPMEDFYLSSMALVDLGVHIAAAIAAGGVFVALLEAVTARRRMVAALTAAGVGRGVHLRALLWQAMLPVAVLLPGSVVLGALMIKQLFPTVYVPGQGIPQCPAGDCTGIDPVPVVEVPQSDVAWTIDWNVLAAIGATGLLVVALLAGAAAATLRTRTDPQALRTT